MAKQCDNCGKGIMVGHNVSHAKNRTRKVFKPNLHVAHMVINGRSQTLKLCTKCLRLLKKGRAKKLQKTQVVANQTPVAAA